VLDPELDGAMPGYMAHLAAGRDCAADQSLRKQLLETLRTRRAEEAER
jgi:hypothetical protein